MVNPVPGYKVTTAYGIRGKHWSCNANSSGGVHTGADFAAPAGTRVVAARPGTVKHVNYGTAFGSKQVAVVCSDGGEDFYAHMRARVADGTKVAAGDKVGEVGAEGNVTGAHLHFEKHKQAGSWSCSNHTNPQPSIDYSEGSNVSNNLDYKYLGKPSGTLSVATSYKDLDQSKWDPPRAGLEHTLVYLNVRPTFKPGKTTGAIRVRLVRADGDASAYHDYPIDADCLEDGTQLITHTYFELGDGKVTRIQVRCQGGLASAVIGTRYTKKAVVVD